MNRNTVLMLSLSLLMVLAVSASFPCVVHGEILQDWTVDSGGGKVTESNGALTFSGDERSPGPLLYREFAPRDDFEISFQLKAATLGEVDRDPNGAGEGFMLSLWPSTDFGMPTGVAFEMRARGGGQFLLDRHDNAWAWDWTPFIYNTLEYNDGYSYWHNSSQQVTENALVKPNFWYTVNLSVKNSPFTVTATVTNETGAILGTFSISDMLNFSFSDIRFLAISSGFGGEFYVRNFTIRDAQPASSASLTIAAEPSVIVGSPVNIHGSLATDGVGLPNELVVLKYTFPGVKEWYPIGSAYTDTAGNYSIQWVNTATGAFTLRAEWEGNSDLPRASANVTLNSLPSQNGVFFVESNSTVTSLAFNSTTSELSFTVSGPSGTSGYVKATVAKSLLPNGAETTIYLDGNQLSYELHETADSWVFTFNYHHSTHTVTLDLSLNQTPENPFVGEDSVWILAVVASTLLILVLGVFIQKKKTG